MTIARTQVLKLRLKRIEEGCRCKQCKLKKLENPSQKKQIKELDEIDDSAPNALDTKTLWPSQSSAEGGGEGDAGRGSDGKTKRAAEVCQASGCVFCGFLVRVCKRVCVGSRIRVHLCECMRSLWFDWGTCKVADAKKLCTSNSYV